MCIVVLSIDYNITKMLIAKGLKMNIGIIEKADFFDIGVLIKKSYQKKIYNGKIKFITMNGNDKIDILVLNNISSNSILNNYFKKLHSNSIVIVNTDIKELIGVVLKQDFNIVTFGFNQKSSITISSFIAGDKDTYTICIQRDIYTIEGLEFFEQEFIINSNDISESDILLIVSILIVLGLSTEEIKLSFLD